MAVVDVVEQRPGEAEVDVLVAFLAFLHHSREDPHHLRIDQPLLIQLVGLRLQRLLYLTKLVVMLLDLLLLVLNLEV